MTPNEILLVAGMALITFGVRYPMLVLVGRVQLPDSVARALRYVPVAVLTAICIPAMLYPKDNRVWLALDNPWLLAGVITILVSWRTRNLLLTIIVGMAAFLLLRALFSQ